MNRQWKNKGHEFDEIGYNLKDKKFLILYGNPLILDGIITVCQDKKSNIDWEIIIVNKDEKLRENGYKGLPVKSIECLKDLDISKCIFVVGAVKNCTVNELKNELYKMNVKENAIYEQKEFLFIYLPIYFLYVKNIVFFASINIVPDTKCNLNCKNCLNFTPYIKQHVIDKIEDIKEDIDLFFENVNLVYRFNISGGEPFLNKNLKDIVEYVYRKYIDKIIVLETVTNGTVVPGDELCRSLSDCGVEVSLDNYCHALKDKRNTFVEVKNKLDEYSVQYEINNVDKWVSIYPRKNEIETNDTESLQKLYERCWCQWASLQNKRISGCTYAHFATKAGLVKSDEKCYFDLTGKVDKKELIEFRAGFNEYGYTNFCSKCKGYYISDEYVPVAEQAER